jgi:hypothetical protein
MSKMTKWFPPHIKPVREGVYEISFKYWPKKDAPMYAAWNGSRWSVWSHLIKDDLYHARFLYADQGKYWRGFTEKQA